MHTLANNHLRLEFDAQGRLIGLTDAAGNVSAPLDPSAVTNAFDLYLRAADGEVMAVTPTADPDISVQRTDKGQVLHAVWPCAGDWGRLTVTGRVELAADSRLAAFTADIDNQTDCALWELTYPRVSGLTEFQGVDGPSCMVEPREVGEMTPNPVHHVNTHTPKIPDWARTEFGAFDVEHRGAIAYSYPGMWVMQFMAYGHPDAGGVYFAAHDGQALYKRFGFYADGDTGQHAAFAMKQYPRDRLARGEAFSSFYPVMLGVYPGPWWNASALYREWALQQQWCRRGPVKDRGDIPQWCKDLDVWYWNWQYADAGHPMQIVPAIRTLKERFGCNVALHWYGLGGESFNGSWRRPEIYPDSEDTRYICIEGLKELHDMDVRALPYIQGRNWDWHNLSFKRANGMDWIARNADGTPGNVWHGSRVTMCPTAAVWHDMVKAVNSRMMREIGTDGAYYDQITSCYAVPCFNTDHGHPAGGHDHWHRGYRDMMEKIQADTKAASPDNVATSEGTIECLLDLFDLDLARKASDFRGMTGAEDTLPIPLYHSVYHDYHMTYGTVMTFGAKNLDHFRYAEAMCLTGGGQLMVSGFFAGDENNPKVTEHLAWIGTLIRARMAARRWLNLGVWKPPLSIDCDRIAIDYDPNKPPKRDLPAVLTGCYALDGSVCCVLVNPTGADRDVTLHLDPAVYGLDKAACRLRAVHPEAGSIADSLDGPSETGHTIPAHSAHVWILESGGSA